jgi:protein SCO1/2
MSEVEQSADIGHQHRAAPRPWGPIVAVLVLAFAVAAVFWLQWRQTPSIGGPFKLTDAMSGRAVSDQDFRGKWLLVFFGYTHCPDVCPTTLGDIADSMSQLGPLADRVQPLFITVDPERDARQVLADYTAAFDPRIVGLTGRADQIAAVARSYRVYYAKRIIGDDYTMDHTGAIYVMRPDGTYASSLFGTDGASAMTRRLRQLIGNGGG